jgi:hypothetical protein
MDNSQALIVRLDAALARRARQIVAGHSSYADLSELVAVALENQLALEGAHAEGEASATPRRAHAGGDGAAESLVRLLARPQETPRTVERAPAPAEALFSMTNRLFPLKVAARVLANSERGVHVEAFQRDAAAAARALGLKLRAEDSQSARRAGSRRWIALPVGEDEAAALNRYVHHFTLLETSAGAGGPLANLGLAGIAEDDSPALTELGAQLALAENPVLDRGGSSDAVLGEEERQLMSRALRSNPHEVAALRQFHGVVGDHGGRQQDVDASLRLANAGWSQAQAVAQRAAMVGRLRDLGLAEVEGRGPAARIRLAPQTESVLMEGAVLD